MKLKNHSLVSDEPYIVESPFYETTRNGKHTLRKVFLALTQSMLIIKSRKTISEESDHRNASRLLSSKWDVESTFYPISSLQISIFKKSQRQTLKVCFHNISHRYFQLQETFSQKVLWTLWCKQIIGLQQTYSCNSHNSGNKGLDWSIIRAKDKNQKLRWHDKHLYLGIKREEEDSSRPTPVPGLGQSENYKIFYLKPQYFGCWDQSEHWVQCGSNH